MRVLVCAVGRLKTGPERDLASRYADRLAGIGRSLALGPLEIVEIEESRAKRPEDRRSEEAEKLLAAARGAMVVVLDAKGTALSSEAFASRIAAWRDEGQSCVAFLLGGPDGHDARIRSQAALTLSLGPMTFPHQIARILLAEQLYRAATIIAGHPYHRA